MGFVKGKVVRKSKLPSEIEPGNLEYTSLFATEKPKVKPDVKLSG